MNMGILTVTLLFPLLVSASVYEGNEHWTIYDDKPAGATIERVYDASKKSDVVEFKGDGKRNAYIIGSRKGAKAWKNQSEKKIKWEMNFKEKFKISIFVETEQGERTLLYYSHPEDRGVLKTKYIRFGLGTSTIQGNWVTIERNLEKDLKKFNPDNHLIAVNGFKVQGSGKMGKIELLQEKENPPVELTNRKVYEDAEQGDGSNWEIIKITPSGKETPKGATVNAIFDERKDSNVIQFKGEGRENSYLLGGKTENQAKAWSEQERHIFSWEMKSSEKYRITLYTKTKKGYRSFYITHQDGDGGLKKNKYIYLGMGAKSKSGTWQTFTVDVEKEIKKYEPDNELISINGMKVQGSMEIDNVVLGGKKEISEERLKKAELLKLALLGSEAPEKGVHIYRQHNIAYIFVSAMSHNYARYFMGLTKVDISNPPNIKELGYDGSMLRSYIDDTLLPKEYFSSLEQDILLDFIPIENGTFNMIVTSQIHVDKYESESRVAPLRDALEQGLPFYEEAPENARTDRDYYHVRESRVYIVPADNKSLKQVSLYTEDERRFRTIAHEYFSYNSKFRLLTLQGVDDDEGWHSDVIYISKNLKKFTKIPEISPYDEEDMRWRKVSFLEDFSIVVHNHDDTGLGTDIIDTYDGTKLPELVKIENR